MKCAKCNTQLIWQSDFDYADYELKGNGIVTVYLCPHCNRMYEFYFNEDGELERTEMLELKESEEE